MFLFLLFRLYLDSSLSPYKYEFGITFKNEIHKCFFLIYFIFWMIWYVLSKGTSHLKDSVEFIVPSLPSWEMFIKLLMKSVATSRCFDGRRCRRIWKPICSSFNLCPSHLLIWSLSQPACFFLLQSTEMVNLDEDFLAASVHFLNLLRHPEFPGGA